MSSRHVTLQRRTRLWVWATIAYNVVEATVALAKAVSIPVIASGGVAGIEDIHALRPHVGDGVTGVITGRALYDGRLDLAAALAVAAAA